MDSRLGAGASRDVQDEDFPSSTDGPYMACVSQGQQLGCAWYDVEADELLVMQAAEDHSSGPLSHQMLHLVKLHVQPSIIYTPAKSDQEFVEALKQSPGELQAGDDDGVITRASSWDVVGGDAAAAEAEGRPAGGLSGGADVRLERSSLFGLEAARHVLQQLHVRSLMPPGLSSQERLLRLNTALSLSSTLQVCAAGALLTILHNEGLLGGGGGRGDSEIGDEEGEEEGEEGQQRPRRRRRTCSGWGGGGGMVVEHVREQNMEGQLVVDALSLHALQVFQHESHPSAFVGSAKEGFSIFGLIKCATPMGKQMLRLWFLRPIVNLQVLAARQDAVSMFCRLPDLAKPLQSLLRKTRDVGQLLHTRLRATQGSPSARDFSQFLESLSSLLLLRDNFAAMLVEWQQQQQRQEGRSGLHPEWQQQQQQDGSGPHPTGTCAAPHNVSGSYSSSLGGGGGAPDPAATDAATGAPGQPPQLPDIAYKVLSCIGDQVAECRQLVSEVLDLQQAEEGAVCGEADGSFLVASGVCPELDSMKQVYGALPEVLTQALEHEMRRLPRALVSRAFQRNWSFKYMPQVGFVLRVEGGGLDEQQLEHLPDYEMAFEGVTEDGPGMFYRCGTASQLDQQYGDLLHKIMDLERSICGELVSRLLERYGQPLRCAVAAVAELDCLLALGVAARQYGWVRPVLTRDNVLCIKDGRHPLTELLVDSYMPNTTSMGEARDRIQVLTGPNYSGKSCYMKQVGLIVFMAHVGCFVPAASAVVGLTDRIFTRISSAEGWLAAMGQRPASTFMVDLSQVAAMCRLATGRSLCLIDEFGKGTLSDDGAGLLVGALSYFAGMLPQAPRVVACTHFTELLQEGLLPRGPWFQFLTMDIVTKLRRRRAAGTSSGADPAGSSFSIRSGASSAEAAAAEQADVEDIVFLYRVVPGFVAPSYGVHCARLVGVPESVLARALGIMQRRAAGRPVLPLPLDPGQRGCRIRLLRRLVAVDVRDTLAVCQFLEHSASVEEGSGA